MQAVASDVISREKSISADLSSVWQPLLKALPILADLNRGEILLYRFVSDREAVIVSHALPSSVPPNSPSSRAGERVTPVENPTLFGAWLRRRNLLDFIRVPGGRWNPGEDLAPRVQEIHPAIGGEDGSQGALVIEKTLIEHERHHRRSKLFRIYLRKLVQSALSGDLLGAQNLSTFGEHDGIVLVNPQLRILYASGVATNLYRRVGFNEDLVGQVLTALHSSDEILASEAIDCGRCLEREISVMGRIWIKKALPIVVPDRGFAGWRTWTGPTTRKSGLLPKGSETPEMPKKLAGVFLCIHDATDLRQREQLLRSKSALIQEIHHRVKNNLATVAAILRMQARRVENPEARRILEEAVSRVQSVSTVHEFLSAPESRFINIKDLSNRILRQTIGIPGESEGIVPPDKTIQYHVHGPNVYLPAQQATACALVVNELLQNAVEHAYTHAEVGLVEVELQDLGDNVSITIRDDGVGLPLGFNPRIGGGLGLQIVRTLVQDDLKGHFEMHTENGTAAIVTFPKGRIGGSE
ncbi:MAG: sensor histidine kinase [Chloroflexi bacterium]|nr:sensor histidine kinase [Chloroflexota bacterium]